MKKQTILSGLILLTLFSSNLVFTQETTADPALDRIIELKELRQQKIEKWETQAMLALVMVITVGVISAVIAFLQKFKFRGNKAVTATLGLVATIITVIDASVYPDYQTLQRTISKARWILEDVEDDLSTPVKPEDRAIWREGIREKLKEILRIEDEFLSSREPLYFELVHSAYAKTKLPEWVTNPPSDNYYLYFIGTSQSVSLGEAKNLALEDAQKAASDYLVLQIQNIEGFANKPINYEALSEFLTKSAEVYRTQYSMDKEKGEYRFYTLLRLAKSYVEIDLTFFAIEENIDVHDTKMLNKKLQSTVSPRKAYYNERVATYSELLESAKASLDPLDHQRFLEARQIRKSGAPQKALPALEEITQKYPRFFMGWYNLGLAYDALHDSVRADNAYNKAIQLEPGQSTREASIYNTYGDFLRRHKNYVEAKKWFEKALEVNPNHALARNNLQVMRGLLGE